MNREIKFRGKRIESNEWVYGSLIIHPKNHYYISFYDENMLNIVAKIDPKTVGQYIGIEDKNKVEIYAGDILISETNRITYQNDGTNLVTKSSARFICTYNQDYLRYEFMGIPKDKKTFVATIRESLIDNKNLEIISNIHDNPELLEEEND